MSRRDVTLAVKIALHERIKNQPPNTSHHQLVEITGVPKSTVAHIIQQQEKLQDKWTLCNGKQETLQKKKCEGVEEALNQWFSVVTGRGARVSALSLKSKSVS
jgi:hypothetical protein